MYGHAPAWSERIQVSRDGVLVAEHLGAYDPAERQLYLEFGADIRRGDVIGVRDLTRRVIEETESWLGAGVVARIEDAPPYLPDLGALYRPIPGGFNRATRVYDEPGLTPLWTGPCSVKAESTIGSDVEVAEQKVTAQPFSITVPLEVVDVRPDDVFKVSSSRDQRLTVRSLVVTRIEGGSEEQGRLIRCSDNQG